MRVLVCGGRDYTDYTKVDSVLDGIHASTPIRAIIHGNARGADRCGGDWAMRRVGVSNWPVPAQWSKFGKAAGPKRNQAMIGLQPDLVVAFPGGRGTADMVKRARAAGVTVIEVTPHPDQMR